MVDKTKDWIWDLETYPNCFSGVFGNADSRKCLTFEISDRKDDSQRLRQFIGHLRAEECRMVGFNSIGFDYPVLHYFLKHPDATVKDIYNFAMEIINAPEDKKFDHIVWSRDRFVEQVDLYKIHHFDNKARATSLKMLEFNMRSDNIEDLPFKPGTVLKHKEIDELLKYNKWDMYQTYLFYLQSIPQIEFREQLTQKYGKDFMNHNDTKIGKDYFIMELESNIPGSCYIKEGKTRKIRQTKRNSIKLNECILPYIHFDRPEFQAVLDWLKNQEITETKGAFSDIPEHELGDLAQYAAMRTKQKKLSKQPSQADIEKYRKELPLCWIEERQLKSGKVSYYLCWNVCDGLNAVLNGFQYDFGTGGIHGSIESTVVRSDDEYLIVDQDVASYYPNLAIANRVYPLHLGESFCDIYQDVYVQRKSYPKGSVENAMLKLALNGVYGDSNNKFSPFYDPKYTMTITINGQLSLCMLAEKLLEVPSLEMIAINTDGLTYRVRHEYVDLAQRVCEDWEELTKLDLERADYEVMAIRDVNSYIAKGVDGKLKNKGAYEWKDLGWHKNQSALIVPMAAEKALIEGVPVEETIMNHNNKWDFLLRTKVPRSSRLISVDEFGNETELQNICRYYPSTDGEHLVKIMPPLPNPKMEKVWRCPETGDEIITKNKTQEAKPKRKGYEMVEEREQVPEERRIGIETGWKVKVCNDIKDFEWDVNYDYYIREAKKLVDPLIGD